MSNYSFDVAVISVRNKRDYNEDTFNVNVDTPYPYFGVYDGHGGNEISNALAKDIPKKLEEILAGDLSEVDIKDLLTFMLVNLDVEYEEEDLNGGSTVGLLISDGEYLHCLNLGDTEAYYIEGGNIIQLTHVHKPSDPFEKRRIENEGGSVKNGRIFGSLAVSRAIGDFSYKPSVSSKPAYNTVKLTPGYIVLASDGLFDGVVVGTAASIVMDGSAPMEIAKKLVQTAIKNGSQDNITVQVIKVKAGGSVNEVQEYVADTIELPEPTLTPILQLKSIKDIELPFSMFYLSKQQQKFVTDKLNLNLDLPCWIPQIEISRKLFGEDGVKALKLAEAFYKVPFVWATEFANVHTTFAYDEVPFEIDGVMYLGAEQYFQSQKSVGTSDEQVVARKMLTATPENAFRLGRAYQMRFDWDKFKDKAMFDALSAKFKVDKNARDLLLSTGTHLLVQLKPNDPYWGTGLDGKGLNKLGNMVQHIRNSMI